jgi:DNA-binding NarL/FixJ family response regulator
MRELSQHGPVLSAREADVLRCIADGYSNAHIARLLSCSQHTVKNVLHGMMSRLQLRNRAHAAAYAVRTGLI